mmetsp:Transcript_70120/g.164106  ORF Transcript_70120/g.164106 Transcript_70120/m.164106 type:complete len:200 (-) Transcript_70120:819-1418(-)
MPWLHKFVDNGGQTRFTHAPGPGPQISIVDARIGMALGPGLGPLVSDPAPEKPRRAPECRSWTRKKSFFTSSVNKCRSVLLAEPLSRLTPFTSCSAVMPPSSCTMSNTMLGSEMWRSMAASQLTISGSVITWMNSSRSKTPSPVSSAASNSDFIFLMCWCRFFSVFRIMILSSLSAAWKVSLRNTPLITAIRAYPMVIL